MRLTKNARSLRRSQTDAETNLWRLLRSRGLSTRKFRRQHPIGPYIADFYCPSARLIIELDGGQHTERAAYDARRTQYFNSLGIRVLRIWNPDMLNAPGTVLAAILAALPPRRP